jgi:hypothetical protein
LTGKWAEIELEMSHTLDETQIVIPSITTNYRVFNISANRYNQ